jgi:hypothetical protein
LKSLKGGGRSLEQFGGLGFFFLQNLTEMAVQLLSADFMQLCIIFSVFLFGIPILFRIVHFLIAQGQKALMALEGRPLSGRRK